MNSNLESSGAIRNAIRAFSAFLDRPIFWLLGIVYQIFFNVASADVFSNATVMRFYGRIQLILGVYMLFQLAMTIIRGIVDPDNFIDGKNNGGGLIYRILISLTLFSLLIPINTSKSNEYERQINNNGILFGTLYSLQNRILLNNTLGKLVLGTTDGGTYMDTGTNANNMQIAAKRFTTTVVKGFYRVNLLPDKDDPSIVSNRVCQDADSAKTIRYYQSESVDAGDVISLVNETCITDDSNILSYGPGVIGDWLGNKKYVFAYTPFLPAIVGAVFVFLIISLTIDIAVRAVKLVILRMIAPIPIISYMDPKGSKDGAFNAWVKSLTGTYLDLFIRLATMYFILFIIQEMIANGVVINNNRGAVGLLSLIFIWIGLFVFAKEAPKFIREALGLKGDGGKLFGGFGDLAGIVATGAGIGASAAGAIGSFRANARASRMADETRQAFGMTDMFGNPIDPNSTLNRAKHILSGIAGGISGTATGVGAAVKAKDHQFRSALEAMQKRNASVIAKGNDGSTFLGRVGSSWQQYMTGDGSAAELERQIETNKARIDALKEIKSRVSGETVKKDWTYGDLGIATDQAGNAIGQVNFKAFEANLAASRSRGDGLVHFVDEAGTSHTISLDDAEKQRGFLLKNNEDDYILKHTTGTVAPTDVDNQLMIFLNNARILGGSSQFITNADGTITKGDDVPITNRNSVNDAIDYFNAYNTQLGRQNAVNKANDRYSGKK